MTCPECGDEFLAGQILCAACGRSADDAPTRTAPAGVPVTQAPGPESVVPQVPAQDPAPPRFASIPRPPQYERFEDTARPGEDLSRLFNSVRGFLRPRQED